MWYGQKNSGIFDKSFSQEVEHKVVDTALIPYFHLAMKYRLNNVPHNVGSLVSSPKKTVTCGPTHHTANTNTYTS